MNVVQIARNTMLGVALGCFGLAVFGVEKISTINLVPLGLLLWCLSVMVKVSNAKDGVFF